MRHPVFGVASTEERRDADEFYEELVGASEPTRFAVPPREAPLPDRRARPPTPVQSSAPTIALGSTTIDAGNVTDAGLWMVDTDRNVAAQAITPLRVSATKQLLASERTGPTAAQYDRLVDALVLAGLPMSMWAAAIAIFEAEPSRAFGFSGDALARELLSARSDVAAAGARLAAPGVRRWLARAAEVADFAWDDTSTATLTTSVQRVVAAANATTAVGLAVTACAALGQTSLQLLAAFPTPTARAEAATAIARLAPEQRAALRFLAGAGGASAVQAKLRGGAVAEALQRQHARIIERARALRERLAAPLPNLYPMLAPW